MRVQEDVAAGRLSMARQRLRGLIGSYLHRLGLREQLAELYRRDDLLSQAGRWSFLSQSVNPEELRAFERELAHPVHRMRAIGWSGPEGAAGDGATATSCLRAEAEKKVCRPISWERTTDVQTVGTWGGRLFAAVLILVVGLVVVGVISFFIEGVKTVSEWLNG
jgi:hypothetical protein